MHSQAERAAAARCVQIVSLPALQAQRLSWHPSLVMWAGNNENEQALDWFQESWNNPQVSLTAQRSGKPAHIYPGPWLRTFAYATLSERCPLTVLTASTVTNMGLRV
jgi:hypothetical protein